MMSESLKAHPLLHQWLSLTPTGEIQIFTGKVDLGQGITHALRLIVAQELRLSPSQINVIPASTHFSPDEAVTSGSLSVQHSGNALRCAAAHWRELCRLHMAKLCNVHVSTISCANGQFSLKNHPHINSSNASYAELTSELMWQSSIDCTHVSSPYAVEDKVLMPDSQNALRDDIASKVFGEFKYIQDRVLPEMCHGMVFRPGTLKAEIIASDMQALIHHLKNQHHVLCVHLDGILLGVLTESEYALSKIVLTIENGIKQGKFWRCNTEDPTSNDVTNWLKSQELETTVLVDTTNHMPAEMEHHIHAEFHRPYLQHASIGLCCALAQWSNDNQRLEVWSHSQGIYNLRRDLALAFSMSAELVHVSHVEGAGCYGHNGADDVAFDAAWLAKLLPGRSVRVQWTRQAELGHAPLAPAMAVEIQASVNAQGQISKWIQTVWSQGHGTRPGRGKSPALLGAWQTAIPQPITMAVNAPMTVGGGSERNAEPPYEVPSLKVINHRVLNMPFRVSAMRALGAPTNVFAAESVMDELAALCSQDPLSFRLAHLRNTEQKRAVAVLKKVGDMANWNTTVRSKKTEGWGRGLAYARYKNTGAYCAVVVELIVEEKIKLDRLFIAADLGHVIGANGAVNQLEGGALQAASWALCESAQLSPQGITSNNWQSYNIFKFIDIPAVQVHLISQPLETSLGAGECSSGPTCAAIANAIFDAIGVRMHDMPFTPENLLKTIEADSSLSSS